MSWVSDGSSEISISGSQVTSAPAPNAGSNVYNALWKDEGVGKGKAYWKVTVSEGGLFAGVTDESKFKKGWGCKGLLYGGNLSDGGGLLVGNFGPSPKAGDVVGILLDVDDAKVKVYIDVNGRALGIAFDVPRNTLGDKIYPVIHFSETGGSASIERSEALPSKTTREEEQFQGLSGNWKYASGPFSTDRVTLGIKEENSNSYRGSLHIVNTIGLSISREGPDSPFKGNTGFSTLIGGPSELMKLEGDLGQHTSGGIFALNESGQLTITNGDKVSVWSRYVPGVQPVTKNPFL